MNEYCFLNGKYVLLKKAGISLMDLGLLRGFAVFDFMRSYSGKVFLLDEHIKRLINSANVLNLKLPYSSSKIKNIINQLLKRNKVKEGYVRVVITGGTSEDGITYEYNKPNFFILTHKFTGYDKTPYEKGAKLITREHQRENHLAKSTNYQTLLSLQKRKLAEGAAEVLYVNNNYVLEGASSSFFLFKKNILVTARENILAGTRRKFVLKLAKKKFKLEIRPVKLTELKTANEAFITSTTRNILPIVVVDGMKIGNGKVGANTKYLMKEFNNEIKKFDRN